MLWYAGLIRKPIENTKVRIDNRPFSDELQNNLLRFELFIWREVSHCSNDTFHFRVLLPTSSRGLILIVKNKSNNEYDVTLYTL